MNGGPDECWPDDNIAKQRVFWGEINCNFYTLLKVFKLLHRLCPNHISQTPCWHALMFKGLHSFDAITLFKGMTSFWDNPKSNWVLVDNKFKKMVWFSPHSLKIYLKMSSLSQLRYLIKFFDSDDSRSPPKLRHRMLSCCDPTWIRWMAEKSAAFICCRNTQVEGTYSMVSDRGWGALVGQSWS